VHIEDIESAQVKAAQTRLCNEAAVQLLRHMCFVVQTNVNMQPCTQRTHTQPIGGFYSDGVYTPIHRLVPTGPLTVPVPGVVDKTFGFSQVNPSLEFMVQDSADPFLTVDQLSVLRRQPDYSEQEFFKNLKNLFNSY
jgi:hypothetical protein